MVKTYNCRNKKEEDSHPVEMRETTSIREGYLFCVTALTAKKETLKRQF